MEPCNKDKEEIYAKEGKGVSIVEGRVERDAQVHSRIIEKKVYQTLEVASNGTSAFCRNERWKEVYDTGL